MTPSGINGMTHRWQSANSPGICEDSCQMPMDRLKLY